MWEGAARDGARISPNSRVSRRRSVASGLRSSLPGISTKTLVHANSLKPLPGASRIHLYHDPSGASLLSGYTVPAVFWARMLIEERCIRYVARRTRNEFRCESNYLVYAGCRELCLCNRASDGRRVDPAGFDVQCSCGENCCASAAKRVQHNGIIRPVLAEYPHWIF